MPLPHAPRWLAQVKSYINLDRQYGWHHLVLPMNALFSEEQMRAKLAPLVTPASAAGVAPAPRTIVARGESRRNTWRRSMSGGGPR